MTKNTKIIITLGILVALIPFLGFSGVVKDTFFVLAGITIAVLTYVTNKLLIAKDAKEEIVEEEHAPTFEENKEEFIEQENKKDEHVKEKELEETTEQKQQ